MTDAAPDAIPFNAAMEPPGVVQQLSPLVRRLIAPNGGPFTFTGTCTYLVGTDRLAVIDPGPDDAAHVAALLAAVGGARLEHIAVTHTHRDHSPAAIALKAATGAKIVGCAPHFAARELVLGEIHPLDAANDKTYAPDLVMADGDVLDCGGFSLQALATPGHTMNHLVFALPREQALFSGDHVMAWSTSIVAPPDGSMGSYMASLELLRGRGEKVYWPGHGGPVNEPQRFVRALAHHRRQREHSILGRLDAGDRRIAQIVAAIYETLHPKLRGAAALSVFAHLEDLIGRGLAGSEGPATLAAEFYRL